MITAVQKVILDALETCYALPEPMLQALVQLSENAEPPVFEKSVRQLRYLGLIQPGDNEIWRLPGKSPDPEMIDAFGIMLTLSKTNAPDFARGRPPCKLTFFIPDERGWMSAYKVVPVIPGKEEITSLRAIQDIYPRDHTLLYLLHPGVNVDQLSCPRRCFFVRGKEGCYEFLEPVESQ